MNLQGVLKVQRSLSSFYSKCSGSHILFQNMTMDHSRPKRYFSNPWFHGLIESSEFNEGNWLTRTSDLINLVSTKQPANARNGDGGLYVGIGGIGYMFYHVSESSAFSAEKNQLIEKGLEYIKAALLYTHQNVPLRQTEECAFLLGPAGIYAVAAALHNAAGNTSEAQHFCQLYKSLSSVCTPVNFLDCGGDELLVGRAGYICGALWLQKVFGVPIVPVQELYKVCNSIVASGRTYAQRSKSPSPLMFAYYETEYFGAAHGLSGILQMLMSVPGFLQSDPSAERDVRATVNYLLSLQSLNGNFPCAADEIRSKQRRPEDELVHWCHGAPGVVYLMAKAYLLWQEEHYLQSCIRCADLVWEKGLLKKGPGICHGVAGNGYVFLILYRLTQNAMYLQRALQFANFLFCDEFQAGARSPDSPFSLFEGLAGTVCFLNDLLQPSKAAFPFMEVF